MRKRFVALLMAMLFALSATAYAHDVPDLSKTGTIRITMHMGETAVGGGSLTLYRVGEVLEDDGNYSYVPTGDFADCGLSFDDIQSADLAKALAERTGEVSCETKSIANDGSVTFAELELGLYLFVQREPPKGYYASDPFLVSLPRMVDGSYFYEVDASPKVELEKKPEKPEGPEEPELPQTGQLNWPVPLLVMAGLVLFSLGWKLRFSRKKDSYEK